ncbi:MAG: DUF599 domain-containing protein [Hyphomicrobiaceae bacterium]
MQNFPLSALDIAALGLFVGFIALFEVLAWFGPLAGRGLAAEVQKQRRAWIRQMALREQRHIDAILLSSLSQSNAFFASTSVIGIGGLAAIMGATDTAKAVLERLPFVPTTAASLWELKVILLMAILTYAFFKFAWAFRLSHYTAILYGAMPPAPARQAAHAPAPAFVELSPHATAHADETARLLGLVGEHANSGLRSFYWAFAAIAWFVHPLLLMASSVGVLAILLRREYVSRAAAILRNCDAAAQPEG